jgi:hypothetical protein
MINPLYSPDPYPSLNPSPKEGGTYLIDYLFITEAVEKVEIHLTAKIAKGLRKDRKELNYMVLTLCTLRIPSNRDEYSAVKKIFFNSSRGMR